MIDRHARNRQNKLDITAFGFKFRDVLDIYNSLLFRRQITNAELEELFLIV